MRPSHEFSLIVCTFDRPALLARMLDSCARDSPPAGRSWELLIVENGPSSMTGRGTRAVQGLPIRTVREPRPGKSRALNAGVAAARGELLLFADDDVELRPGWMRAFVEAAREHPEAGWFGGRSIPRWDTGVPEWALREIPAALRGYCCLYDLGHEARSYVKGDLLPIGASMAVKARTFQEIGGYDERLGPLGRSRGVGDDTELVERALNRGISGRYVPGAIVDHYVPADRLNAGAIFRYGVLKGRQQAAMTGSSLTSAMAGLRALEQIARGALQFARGHSERVAVCVLNVGLAIGAASTRRVRERRLHHGSEDGRL